MLEFTKELARRSGALLMVRFTKLRKVETKATISDLVTDADRDTEEWLVQQIEARYPEHAILAEEGVRSSPERLQEGYVWVIDPLDGTVNYTHQLPIFAVSIGLLKDGEPYLGVIYIPMLDELFCAVAGEGATRNGARIRVSKTDALPQSLLATGFPYDKHISARDNLENVAALAKNCRGIRRMGAASVDLAYVACGRLDGYWEEKIKPWDMIVGALLIQEAGGRVSGYDGKTLDLEAGHIAASNGLIHDQLLEVLTPYAQKHQFVP